MNSFLQTFSIYVIHALHGYERHEQRIKKVFGQYRLPFEFITQGDVSHFSKLHLEDYLSKELMEYPNKGQVSCTLNHLFAYEAFLKTGKPYALIFENDPFFLRDPVQVLTDLEKEIKSLTPGFLISLENSTLRFPSYSQIRKGKHLYQADTTRMAGAYLIDRSAAEAIIHELRSHKCDAIIDWWLNHLLAKGIFKIYWLHPPLTEQGSHNGLMQGSISSKERSIYRRIKWLIHRCYKTYIRRLFPEKHIIE